MKITKDVSYLIGLIQTDGHLKSSSRNRGAFSIELAYKDRDIIDKIADLIPYNHQIFSRTRKTNFSENHHSIGLRVYSKEFRDFLKTCNVPVGKKSETVSPPIHLSELSQVDYVRGLIDGDGSLGISQKQYPFITFTTDSDPLKDYVLTFFNKMSNSNYAFNRNTRDNIYNLSFFKEKAVVIAQVLYYDKNVLAIKRKLENAQRIQEWIRPPDMRKAYTIQKWTPVHDSYILTHSLEDSMKTLERTAQSVKLRLWRLRS